MNARRKVIDMTTQDRISIIEQLYMMNSNKGYSRDYFEQQTDDKLLEMINNMYEEGEL